MNAMKIARWLAAGMATAAGAYGAYAGAAWLRYGHAKPARGKGRDPLLDRFMPVYEVAERHRINVAAPAEVTMAVAGEIELLDSAVVRAIFKGRELLMRSRPDGQARPRGLLADVKGLGWGV